MNCLVAILFFSLVAVFGVKSADDKCVKNAEDFGKCISDDLQKNKDDDDKKLGKVRDRINQCFNDSGCQPPSAFHEPILPRFVKLFWEGLPAEGKTCLASILSKKTLSVVNQCLKEQKVDEIKEGVFEEKELDEFSNSLPRHRQLIKGVGKTLIALRQCRTNKGDKVVTTVAQCAATIKTDVEKEVCKRLDKCRKEKVSDTCYQKAQKIEQALCACGKNKLKEIIKSIETLESKGQSVSTRDLLKTFCSTCQDDKEEILDSVSKCFKDKKVTVSEADNLNTAIFFLSVGIHDPSGPVHAITSIFEEEDGTYTKSYLPVAKQYFQDVLDSYDCGCTK